MAELVADCPRCGVKSITFDVTGDLRTKQRHGWQDLYEAFSICRHCNRSTVFVLAVSEYRWADEVREHGPSALKSLVLNGVMRVETFIGLADQATVETPSDTPEKIAGIFNEGARCLAIGCFNAAGTMFRLAIDLATSPLLPPDGEPNRWTRDRLGPRVKWLLDSGKLSQDLHDLADCVREDGNDGAHVGNLGQAEARDLLDFTVELLDRLYSAPARIAAANARRGERRALANPESKA